LPYAFVQHEAALTGLAAQTDYAYEVSVRDVTLTEGSFRTAPAAGTGQVRFAAFGDSGTGSVEQKKLAVLLSDQQPDLLLHTGDLAYQSGTLQELQDYFFGIYGGWLASRSVAPSIGNHDDVTFEAAAFLNSFVLPLNAPAGVQERYYSFDFGPAHFVALDTEHAFLDPALRAEQLSWLRADLAATTRPWKIVFFHRPPYDSGPHHAPVLDVRQAFGPVFEELGVQLVLSGHEHIYERTVPWQQSGGPGAPVYVVTGGGGGPLHQAGRAAFTAVARAAHHYVRATVTATTLTLQAVDLTGAVFDTYVLDRTTQAQDAEPPVVTFNAPSAGANVSGQVGVGVTATDDTRVEKVDLYVDGVLKASDLTAPYQFSWDASGAAAGAHTLRATAYDLAGRAASATRSVSIGGAAVPDIVLYAADAAELHGAWQVESDASAAGGRRVRNPNAGLPKVDVALASPATYFEVTFAAEAGRPYHLWLRMRADGNAYPNDSVHVQFDQSETAGGAAAWRIGTTDATWVSLEDRAGAGMSGWGWNDNGWAGMGPPVYFATSGQQRMRVQVREDGLSIDQIVISPGTYLARSPGALKNDTTILPPQ
jgi:3',5'-cyclic AMP phosphodiesterase CpdA